MKVVDIGCGQKKLPGSIGIDFSEISEADIVLDLTVERLPFENDEVDYIYSSHCLEHLTTSGFIHVISEVYRVLKPTGSFFLTVPYFTNTSNFANPFHNNNICFNEHTFRFFSSDPTTNAMPESYYSTPSCPQWGLRYSANSELNVEFSLEYVNFYYFPEFQTLSENEKFLARNSQLNVVEQISYLLKPVKPVPLRTETAPIETGEPSSFLKEQVAYLREQIVFFEHNSMSFNIHDEPSKLIMENINDVEFISSGVVTVGRLTFPVYELINTMNLIIQSNQSQIDDYLAKED